MPRLKVIKPEDATGDVKELFNAAEKKMGKIPNIFRGMGNSAAALKVYLQASEALSQGELSPQDREAVYLAVSQNNDCNYCLSAHTVVAKGAGLSDEEILAIRRFAPLREPQKVLVQFVGRVMKTKGFVEDREIEEVKEAGYTDGQICEAIAYIGLATYSNLFNHVFGAELDFPKAPALSS